MNMCILGTIATGVETLRARVEYNMERGASKYCSEWKLFTTEIMVLYGQNITDMEGMGAFLTTDEEIKWIKIMDVSINCIPCLKCLNKKGLYK